MSRPWLRWLGVGVILVLVLSLGIGIGLGIYGRNLPQTAPQQETLIYGQNQLSPGNPAALRVVVRQVGNGAAVPDAGLTVTLQPRGGGKAVALYAGKTDLSGSAQVHFTVPEDADPDSLLIVETRSSHGNDRTEQPVQISRNYKVLLTTDKPIYQPGQLIRMRVLALGATDQRPATSQPVTVTVTDARGNKVFQQPLTTTVYGVAAVDFQLANEVNSGDYKIAAEMAGISSETTVLVQPYVLPRFKLTAQPEASFYLPGETVRGALNAQYFFGKAVEQGRVVLTGYTFDVQLNQVFQIEGQTDAQGQYAFEFKLPEYLVGGGLEQGTGTFILEAAVTDGAEHTERTQVAIPVARDRILVELVPESGEFVIGVENLVYIMTTTPDGAPVACSLFIQVEGQNYSLKSDAHGLAVWKYTPSSYWQSVMVVAQDAQGHTAQSQMDFQTQSYSPVLLRPDKAIYQVGETMTLTVFSTQGTGSFYLDIVRDGQTVSTRVLEAQNGKAEVAVDLTPDLYGTLALHAYVIPVGGEIQRDTRLVIVDAPQSLGVKIQPDRTVYAPGDKAGVDFIITGADGKSVPATLGLSAVDEAVYALQEQDPGFLKVYFLLEKELLTPKYDLHGFSLTESVIYPEQEAALRADQQIAAQAALAGGLLVPGFSLSVNTRSEALAQIYEDQQRYFQIAGDLWLFWLIALPLVILMMTLFWMGRDHVFLRSLGVGALALVIMVVAGAITLPLWEYLEEMSLWILLGVSGVSWLVVFGHAVAVKDPLRSWVLALWFFYVLILGGLVYLGNDLGSALNESWLMAAAWLTLIFPVIYFISGAGQFVQGRRWLAAGYWSIGTPVVIIAVVALSMSMNSSLGGMPAGGVVMQEPMMDGALPPMAMEEAVLFNAVEAPMEMERQETATASADKSGAQTAAEPRLRQNFGETMVWLPELRTDEQGRLHLDLPLFDNITTWRLTAMAHSDSGQLGMATAPLKVFQDFFVDFDLPYALTQHDEVSLPVAVYNYLDQPQSVRLVLEPAGWFELMEGGEKTVALEPNEVSVVYFRIKVTAVQGRYRPTVRAYGERLSDATTATHDVLIVPDGKRFTDTWSGSLTETQERTVFLPDAVIPGTAQVEVKIYPSVMSQVVEGMDSILQMPNGCFEQTSSSTYPDVLVLDYMKRTGQSTPEIRMKAEQYINIGYQRLTTFEVVGGGFSLFGEAPADRMLTAYGLMEFTDMAQVYPVDKAFVDRAAQWLMGQQQSDGTWTNDQGLVHESSLSNLGGDRTPVTAYIVWALIHAGYKDEPVTQRGLAYVQEHAGAVKDPYALALVANALVVGAPDDGMTQSTLERLAGMAQQEGKNIWWESGVATMMGSTDQTASLETTALAAYAFIKANVHPELVNPALNYLVEQKDERGTWYSTQATILSLKALMASVTAGGEQTDARVTVGLNGSRHEPLQINAGNYDVVQVVTFEDVKPGENLVQLAVEGQASLMAQVTVRYYLPWNALPEISAEEKPAMDIQVHYDRTQLRVDDTVGVSVTVVLREGTVDWALVDLGTPPGFTVLTDELEARVAHDLTAEVVGGRLKKFELTGRQALIYLQGLEAGKPFTFSYRLRARFPLTAKAPASQAYDYYNPGSRGEQPPTTLVVQP